MPGLDELRKRVEAAEEQFGLITTQSRKYSERLTQLVSQMEQAHSEQHREIAALNAQLGQYEQENGQLKSMLLGLLQAMENGDGSLIDNTVRDMESRIGRLIGAPEGVAETTPETDAAVDDSVVAGDGEPQGALVEEFDAIAGIAPEDVMIEDEAALADVLDEELIELEDDLVEVAVSEPATTKATAAGADEAAFGDDVEAEGNVTDVESTPAKAPEPEMVTLDDAPDDVDGTPDDEELAASAHNLLDRVEAAANALLAAGADDDADPMEHELTDEISALLERAVNGTSDETEDDTAEVMLAEEAVAESATDTDVMPEAPEEAVDEAKANAA